MGGEDCGHGQGAVFGRRQLRHRSADQQIRLSACLRSNRAGQWNGCCTEKCQQTFSGNNVSNNSVLLITWNLHWNYSSLWKSSLYIFNIIMKIIKMKISQLGLAEWVNQTALVLTSDNIVRWSTVEPRYSIQSRSPKFKGKQKFIGYGGVSLQQGFRFHRVLSYRDPRGWTVQRAPHRLHGCIRWSPNEGYGHGGPGVCLGDDQTEDEEDRRKGDADDALFRRMSPYLT